MLSSLRARATAGAIAILAGFSVACTSRPIDDGGAESYIRWASFEVPINEHVLLRWPKRKMPLRVHLPPPPSGLFEEPLAIFDSVQRAVLDWADVAEPGVPSFEFVDTPADADIPIVWAEEPDGDWYIAYCAWDIQPFARRFGVSHVLITGRWADGRVAELEDIYSTVLHELGHALGIGGHSPDPEDIMSARLSDAAATGLTQRDRETLSVLYSRPIGARIVGGRGSRY